MVYTGQDQSPTMTRKSNAMPELAIVLATYNEAENLTPLVEELELLGEDLEILVVDDSSPDGTYRVARELSWRFDNVTLIQRSRKLGLGSALREGLSASLGSDARFILTMDADFSHDPSDVPRLLATMRTGSADIAQGSRYVSGGRVPNWSPGRRFLSRGANLLFQWGAGGPRESTTNFRVFSRRAASLILSRAKGNGYEFMAEAVLIALAGRLQVVEVPITFTDRMRGESKLGKAQAVADILYSLANVLLYRLGVGRFARKQGSERGALD